MHKKRNTYAATSICSAYSLQLCQAVFHVFFVSGFLYFLLLINNNDTVFFAFSADDFELTIPVSIVSVSLRQFYPNYKDYYYFPAEDMAVHKSIAEFAAAGSKKKATAKTAYRNVSGRFRGIPLGFAKSESNKDSCFYKADYESNDYYLPVTELSGIKSTEKIKDWKKKRLRSFAGREGKQI